MIEEQQKYRSLVMEGEGVRHTGMAPTGPPVALPLARARGRRGARRSRVTHEGADATQARSDFACVSATFQQHMISLAVNIYLIRE